MPTTDCGFPGSEELSGQNLLVQFGPTLRVRIGLDPAFRPGRRVPPTLPPDQFPALVDTGAAESCIDNDLATTLRLPVVDRKEIAGAHGSAEVNMYFGQIHVPRLRFTIYGMFAGVALRGRWATALRAHRPDVPAELHHGLRWPHGRRHPEQQLIP